MIKDLIDNAKVYYENLDFVKALGQDTTQVYLSIGLSILIAYVIYQKLVVGLLFSQKVVDKLMDDNIKYMDTLLIVESKIAELDYQSTKLKETVK